MSQQPEGKPAECAVGACVNPIAFITDRWVLEAAELDPLNLETAMKNELRRQGVDPDVRLKAWRSTTEEGYSYRNLYPNELPDGVEWKWWMWRERLGAWFCRRTCREREVR